MSLLPNRTQLLLFYSYAHEDEKLRDELEKALATLRNEGVLSEWHDRKIGASTDWRKAFLTWTTSPDSASPMCTSARRRGPRNMDVRR